MKEGLQMHPILGFEWSKSNAAPLDLSAKTLQDLGIDAADNNQLSEYIFTGAVRFGGYGECRSIYKRSKLFAEEKEPRNIHLGIDIWWNNNAPVYLPLAGEIESVFDNNGAGDYGPTIIVKHPWKDGSIYALYGHLDRASLSDWKKGDKLRKGQALAKLGQEHENGGWPPHLHFQLIADLEGNTNDYPGVCSASQWPKFRENCPDPSDILGLPKAT